MRNFRKGDIVVDNGFDQLSGEMVTPELWIVDEVLPSNDAFDYVTISCRDPEYKQFFFAEELELVEQRNVG